VPRIWPFSGLLFDERRVGSLAAVTAPPYDTLDGEQQRRLRAASPYNIVHLDLPQAGANGDANGNQYTRAASILERWRRDGVLRPPSGPVVYPYEMRFRFDGVERTLLGMICAVDLDTSERWIVPHEDTMPGPVDDRLRLLRAVHTNLSPVYALSAGSPRPLGLTSWLQAVPQGDPVFEIVDDEGVRHRMWITEDPPPDLAEDESLLIADGHHRYATALRYRDEMRRSAGSGPWERLMMFVVDAGSQRPPVLPIHRAVVDGPAPPAGDRVRDLGELSAGLDDERLTYGIIRRRGGRVVHELARLDGKPPTVCAITAEVRGLDDPRAIQFTHDAAEAEELVRAGRASHAYLLPPTTPRRIREVVDAGGRMPQKSTYFWPKPRTGAVLRPLE
jgi:uncharacterized protein (DUF1015 family)